MTDALWWTLSLLMIMAGLAGTILPALPGTALVLAGIFLGAWVDGFVRVGVGTLTVVSVLAALSFVLEYLAGLMGAKRAGASRWALVGAAIGTVVGLLMGLVGVLFMPLVGAAVGEYAAQQQARRLASGVETSLVKAGEAGPAARGSAHKALHVGVAAWLGLMVGMLAKVVLGFVMVGVFVIALWLAPA